MSSSERLLTITEVVGRFRDAGIGRDDASRRSYVQQLINEGKLDNRLRLAEGRKRASKNDQRITQKSVDAFLKRRTAAGEASNPQGRNNREGRTALQELMARIAVLSEEKEAARLEVVRSQQEAADEILASKKRVLELEHQVRIMGIEAKATLERFLDEQHARETYENVITQLTGPRDLSDLLDS